MHKRAAFTLTLLAAHAAHAGICAPERVVMQVEAEEQRAKQAQPPAGTAEFENVCFNDGETSDWAQLGNARPALVDRLVHACTAILDKRADDRDCAVEVAYFHRDLAGTHDIVAVLDAARPNKIPDYQAPEALGMTRSPRAEPILLARWRALQPIADKQPANADLQNSWAAWRTNAAIALGTVGGADAKAFLTAQLTQKIDRGVKKRAADAIAAIDKRATAPAK